MPHVDTDQGLIPMHGFTNRPSSRAVACAEDPRLNCGPIGSEPQSVEAPKGWPHAVGSPQDGMIASGGIRRFAQLDGVTAPNGQAWPATKVTPGQRVKVTWVKTAAHKTSTYQVFCTKQGWDRSRPLTRASFQLEPVMQLDWPCPGGGWTCKMPTNRSVHWLYLPDDREGWHVLYSVWTVGDTGAAFYQAADVLFVPRPLWTDGRD